MNDIIYRYRGDLMSNEGRKNIFIVDTRHEVLQGEIIREVDDEKFEVSVYFPDGKTLLSQLPKNHVFFSEDAAKHKFVSFIHWEDRKKLYKDVEGHIDFLPEHIGELKGVYPSGNPLRFGERNISFSFVGNVTGKENSPQKIIQIIGGIWEDIERLQDILYVLSYGNDYVKKLIGKFIIIELRSLFPCFIKLSKLDDEYKDNLYLEFKYEVNKLNDELQFIDVRNKISAHRDLNLDLMTTTKLWEKITRYNIFQYIEVFRNHTNKLSKQYPNETLMYFNLRRTPFRSVQEVHQPKDNSYQPFDEEFVP